MELVGVRQIAALFGVTRSAVGNMRARNPDFPAPVSQQGGALLFDRDEIVQWGRRHDQTVHDVPTEAGRPPADGGLDLGTAVRAGLGAVSGRARREVRALSPRDAVRSLIDALAGGWGEQAELAGVLPALRAARRGWSAAAGATTAEALADAHPGAAVDALVGSRALTDAGRLSPSATSARLVAWVVAAAGRVEGQVGDPACGLGGLLVEAAAQAPGRLAPLVGADTDPDAMSATALRLLAHGRRFTAVAADALSPGADDQLAGRFDIVLADPPAGRAAAAPPVDPEFGKVPKGEQSYLWIGLVARMLRVGGRGVVVAPLRTLDQGGVGAAFRSRLLDAGAVLAVVTLPAGMRPGSAPDLAMWVLQRPETPAPRDVLVIDGSVLDVGPDDPLAGPNSLRGIINPFARGDGVRGPWPGALVVGVDRLGADAALTPWALGAVPAPGSGRGPALAVGDSALAVGASSDRVSRLRSESRAPAYRSRALSPDQLADELDALATRLTKAAAELRAQPSTPAEPGEASTLDELVVRGELEVLTLRRSHGEADAPLRDGDVVLRPGLDVPAEVIVGDDATSDEGPGLGGVVLRPRAPHPELSHAIVAAVNAQLAGRWPHSSRGPVPARKVLALVRVPADMGRHGRGAEGTALREQLRQALADLGSSPL